MKGQTTWLSLKGALIGMTLLKKMRYMLQLTEASNLNSPKNFTCPYGKSRTEFTSLITKFTSLGLSDTTFFGCTLEMRGGELIIYQGGVKCCEK